MIMHGVLVGSAVMAAVVALFATRISLLGGRVRGRC